MNYRKTILAALLLGVASCGGGGGLPAAAETGAFGDWTVSTDPFCSATTSNAAGDVLTLAYQEGMFYVQLDAALPLEGAYLMYTISASDRPADFENEFLADENTVVADLRTGFMGLIMAAPETFNVMDYAAENEDHIFSAFAATSALTAFSKCADQEYIDGYAPQEFLYAR